MSTDTVVRLSHFIRWVRHRMQEANNSDNVEDIAAAILAENRNWVDLVLDVALNGEIEHRMFDVLISSPKLTGIHIPSRIEVRYVEDMLRKAVPVMGNAAVLAISMMAMTQPEAERILSILRTSSSLEHLYVVLGSTTDGIAEPLEKYLRESPLETVSLSWSRHQDENNEPVAVSHAAVNLIFDGIGASRSLSTVLVAVSPLEESNAVAKALARAAAQSESLLHILVKDEGPSSRTFTNQICHALKCSDPVRNFDLCFRQSEIGDRFLLELNRSAPWKPLLSQDVPLNYWPSILAKTNTWNEATSHSPLDALFFLMKEKNDVLLQNVRRRRIRKRKRVSLYSP